MEHKRDSKDYLEYAEKLLKKKRKRSKYRAKANATLKARNNDFSKDSKITFLKYTVII